jgi:hypothetical protein
MLQWKPRFSALAAVLALVVIASALGIVFSSYDLFW